MSKRKLQVCGLATALIFGCADAPVTGAADQALIGAASSDLIAGEYIVELSTGTSAPGASTLGGVAVTWVMPVGPSEWLVRVEGVSDVSDSKDPTEADATRAAMGADANVVAVIANRKAAYSLVPTDPLYSFQQWNYATAMRLPQAWDRTIGTSGVRIAIIDTGRTNHPDLIWSSGYDAFSNDNDPTSETVYNHGVHVAGIAGARANNGIGGVGVCWNCTLVPVKISGTGSPTLAAITAGVNWASGVTGGGPRRADVINLSLNIPGGTCSNPDFASLTNAIASAHGRGVVVVASVGNQGAFGADYPADCPNVIGVAAAGPSGALAGFSNRGPNIDLIAPGGEGFAPEYGSDVPDGACARTDPFDPFAGTSGVVSAWSTSNFSHCHRYLSGTSMSAPHVSGVVGLMLARNPGLTPTQIREYLVATARPSAVTCPGPGQCGAGMVDAFGAVEAAVNGLAPTADIAPSALNFGAVGLGSTTALAFMVHNTGPAPLTFTLARPAAPYALTCTTGCTCSAASCTGTLTAGLSSSLSVTFQPTQVGSATANITFTSNAINLPVATVAVTGTGTGPVLTVVDPKNGSLRLWELNHHRGVVMVRNDGNAPLLIHGWSVQYRDDLDGYLAVSGPKSMPPHVVHPGGLFALELICSPSWRTGTYNARFRLATNLGDQPVADISCSMGPYVDDWK